jgi:pre-mRNA-splicing factor SYF2
MPSPGLDQRLLELRLKMNKAKQLNNQAVLAEKKRIEDPKVNEKFISGPAADQMVGDWRLHETAALVARRGLKQNEIDDASYRAQERRNREMGFYPDSYSSQKHVIGEAGFYQVLGPVVGHKPTEEAKSRLVESLKKDQVKRGEYSRKRLRDDDAADVGWINDKNKSYTRKLDKAYGNFTADIKSSLERGTNI